MENSILKLENTAIFQEENLVLSGVNLDVQAGDFLYLIGKTGSGKSSLMKTLYGDLTLKQGTGEIVGFDLRKLREKQVPFLRRKIGIVFQDFKLLNDRTVFENLKFVLKALLDTTYLQLEFLTRGTKVESGVVGRMQIQLHGEACQALMRSPGIDLNTKLSLFVFTIADVTTRGSGDAAAVVRSEWKGCPTGLSLGLGCSRFVAGGG